MLDEATRTAIFKLHEQGHGSRAIAQALKVARATVRQVIRSGHRTVPYRRCCGRSAASRGASRSWSCTRGIKDTWAACTRSC